MGRSCRTHARNKTFAYFGIKLSRKEFIMISMHILKDEIIMGIKENRMLHCIRTSRTQGSCTLVDFSVCFCVSRKIHKLQRTILHHRVS
jgi:hypothetical protein